MKTTIRYRRDEAERGFILPAQHRHSSGDSTTPIIPPARRLWLSPLTDRAGFGARVPEDFASGCNAERTWFTSPQLIARGFSQGDVGRDAPGRAESLRGRLAKGEKVTNPRRR